ncbi:MAG: RNA polymerase factor sigma-54 [Alphaproteobacteria bacterium]|nr:RNA polymerase factor sigma-54 [Alphaproteobacteria bacterium]
MSLSQRLDLRTSQSLVMTPQLQQAIKLLQLSNQDLCAFVAEEIDKNPFLEHGEAGGEGEGLVTSPNDGDDHDVSELPTDSLAEEGPAPADADVPSDGAYDNYAPQDQGGSVYDPSLSPRPLEETIAELPSLRDHLLSQIHVDFSDPAERIIAAALLEFLDEAGYLPAQLDLVRSQLGVAPDLFEAIIVRLQRLDPAGIFARSLKECLTIQLREKNRLDPAMQALLDNLELVAKHEKTALMRKCGVDAEDLADMLTELRALTPKPAIAFAADVAPPVVPDVLLVPLAGGGWHIELNHETLPRVLVNESFYTTLIGGARVATDKAYVSERWQQANWLVKALRQRATTILKVASEIVKQQDNFFIYGVQHLRPLALKNIAEAIEMHESTVSRVTQNKYIATPRGLFELKYFFSGALATTGGEQTVSTLAVRERIKALIDAESVEAILSDDRLTELLKTEGIDVARRTVAKYREAMNIPTSSQRKRIKRGK